VSDLFKGVRRTHAVKRGSALAKDLGISAGGSVSVKAGLSFLRGNKAPYLSVTAEVRNVRGRVMSAGQQHDLVLRLWPDLEDLCAMHLWTVGEGPLHYEANALYWWEMHHGWGKWKPREGQDPAAFFRRHTRWGLRYPHDQDEDPLTWSLSDAGEPDPSDGWLAVGGVWTRNGEAWREHAISVLRDKLRFILRSRQPTLQGALVHALMDHGIDPDWNPGRSA